MGSNRGGGIVVSARANAFEGVLGRPQYRTGWERIGRLPVARGWIAAMIARYGVESCVGISSLVDISRLGAISPFETTVGPHTKERTSMKFAFETLSRCKRSRRASSSAHNRFKIAKGSHKLNGAVGAVSINHQKTVRSVRLFQGGVRSGNPYMR